MGYGWAGKVLDVDLTRGVIKITANDIDTIKTYGAGKGTNARLLWNGVPPEAEPLSPANMLIFGAGLLAGTIVPSANRGIFTFRSPLNGFHYHSAMGGYFASELKHAGFDTIAIRGKSPRPVWLWISDDKVELRDASHLWGKDTQETKYLIREELGKKNAQIVCIGPAGENLVKSASIESSAGASASRAAPGAVMGSKNLKAIAVVGSGDTHVARADRLVELADQILGRAGPLRKGYENLAHGLNQGEVTGGYYGNMTEGYRDLPKDSFFQKEVKAAGDRCQELLDRASERDMACYNCAARCRRAVRRPDGKYAYLKCESWWTFVVAIRAVDYDFALDAFSLCQDYGMDSISASRWIAFAIDLYQNGILTDAQTDGLRLEWGNKEVTLKLLEKIARREGIGDILANGSYEAARQIGNGAEDYVHATKKLEYTPLSTCTHTPYYALVEAVGDKSDFTRNVTAISQALWFRKRPVKEAFLKTDFFTYPKDYVKYIMDDFDYAGHDCEGGCQMAVFDDETYTITDITGLCNNWTGFFSSPPIHNRPLIAELVSCVTGLDIGEDELTTMARRVLNLVRAENIRFGMRRKDEKVSKRFQQKAPAPWVPLDMDIFNQWVDRYYEFRGWNKDGIPHQKTLDELGLSDVREDLERRRILTGSNE